MTYFGTKVRSCPIDSKDVEMLFMKITLKEAVSCGLAISYDNRIFVIPSKERLSIIRITEPDRAIELSPKKAADAVDRFVEAFVYEVGSDLDKVVVYHTGDSSDRGTSWSHLKNLITFSTLLRHKPTLQDVLTTQSSESSSDQACAPRIPSVD